MRGRIGYENDGEAPASMHVAESYGYGVALRKRVAAKARSFEFQYLPFEQ